MAALLRPLLDQDLAVVFYDMTTIRAEGLSQQPGDVCEFGMAKEGLVPAKAPQLCGRRSNPRPQACRDGFEPALAGDQSHPFTPIPEGRATVLLGCRAVSETINHRMLYGE